MEGKETRFGAAAGGLFWPRHDGHEHRRHQRLARQLPADRRASSRCSTCSSGEITPGGIGAGLYGMLVIGAILAVFIAGLMVGRTPEYLGKKVEAFEMKMAMLVVLVLGASILGFTALASVSPRARPGPLNAGPHGFSEILYAFSSQTGNNGSAFAGLTGNTPFYNITGGLAMLLGRYGMIIPILAIAGSMAAKRRVAPSLGTFPTTGPLWTRPAHRRRHHRRRADVLPGPRARPDRRAAPPERRKGLLIHEPRMTLLSVDLGRGTRRFQRFVTLGGAKPTGEPPRPRGILDPDLLRAALPQAFRKLDPRLLIKNPVMFVVEITAVLVTLIAIANVDRHPRQRRRTGGLGFQVQIALWLWFTVLFATYAEAVAEARGRAQAATLRKTRSETTAHRRRADGTLEDVGSSELRKGDIIVVRGGRDDPRRRRRHRGRRPTSTRPRSPASRRRSSRSRAPTSGAPSPAARRSSATGSSIRVTADPGETFLDRMIALVEGAKRQRTPNEIALSILLAGLTIVFLLATVTLRPFGLYAGATVDTVALVALLVCLIPTTIGGLLSAIGIAGMDRVARFNVLAMSGRAVEASGDVDVILLDKTGTITYGNRLAASIIAGAGRRRGRGCSAPRSSPRSATRPPRGARSSTLARERLAELGRPAAPTTTPASRRWRAGSPRRSRSAPRPAPAASARPTAALILKGAVDAIAADLDGAHAGRAPRRDRRDRRPRRHARWPSGRTAGSSA